MEHAHAEFMLICVFDDKMFCDHLLVCDSGHAKARARYICMEFLKS